MNKFKELYIKIFFNFIIFLSSSDLFASSSKLKAWADHTVRDGQRMGLSWMTGALMICGFLSLLGLQFAQGMLARILMGSGLIFGASAIGGFLKGIFG